MCKERGLLTAEGKSIKNNKKNSSRPQGPMEAQESDHHASSGTPERGWAQQFGGQNCPGSSSAILVEPGFLPCLKLTNTQGGSGLDKIPPHGAKPGKMVAISRQHNRSA